MKLNSGIEVDTRSWLHLKYDDLGKNPCWTLLREVYRDAGVDISKYEQYVEHISGEHNKFVGVQEYFEQVKGPPQQGDIVVIWRLSSNTADHLGIYIGDGRFLHVSKSKGVTLEKMNSPAWRKRIIGVWRWKGV